MFTMRGRFAAVAAAFALSGTLVACSDDDDGGGGGGGGDVEVGQGITSEPCPGGNPDRGCIYLGALSDLTEGPFAPLAVPITEAQVAFWDKVNEEGGIGGEYDVNIEEFTRDNKYNPQEHVTRLREIAPNVAALGQSLGSVMTLAGLSLQDQQNLVAVPATWWSGWSFEDSDQGLVLESGASYCVQAVNGMDYMAQEFGDPESVLAVGYPGDYGGDVAAGVERWGEANDVPVETLETAPNAQAGNQDAVVAAIRRQNPDVVSLAVGPAEMAEIVGGSVAAGFEGEFIGAVPTFNPAVLESPAGEAIQAKYRFTAPWGPYGADTPAHEAIAASLNGQPPENDGYVYGWIWSYPLKAVLDQAFESGDLTPEGIRNAVSEATAQYEGALPDRPLGPGNVVTESLIAGPDAEAPTGAAVVEDFATGATTEQLEFEGPCAEAQ